MLLAINPIPAGVLEWLEAFSACVRARDFERGLALFVPGAQGFGTVVEFAPDLLRLQKDQWRHVWPNTRGFHFLTGPLDVILSVDGSQACVLTLWESEGLRDDGSAFLRRGRCTTVLQRSPTSPCGWLAVHTHYSKSPSGNL